MLKLILGRQKSGKTQKCLEEARDIARNGKSVIMLVPEQYSFQCQRHLLNELGSELSNKIEIHSFTSLCEAICSVNGGLSGYVVDDATRYILVGLALRNVRDSLTIYSKYVESSSFIKQMVSVITEFKQSAVSSDDLTKLSEITETANFRDKLHDISLVYSAYNALLSNRFIDQFDMIERTLNVMNNNSYFYGKTVIVDEFKGFTKSQFLMLQRIISGSEDAIVSLCCDSIIDTNETDIFKNVKKSARILMDFAKNSSIGAEIIKTECDATSFNNDIIKLEMHLAGLSSDPFDEVPQNIKITCAPTVYDEVESVMKTIRCSVREEGMRYKDFVIISRNDDCYSPIIDEFSELYDIPCFTDKRVPLMSLPFSVMVLSLVKAALSFETEDILRFVKTGLCGVAQSDISTLENYVYVWNINGKKWLDEWDMKVDGLSQKDDTVKLEHLNDIRQRVIGPISKLKSNLNNNAVNMCKALFIACDELGVQKSLAKYCHSLERNGFIQEAEYQKVGYDAVIKSLDKIVAVMGDEVISVREFVDMLSNVLSFETVGEIPKTLDQVVFGTADRIKPLRPKVVFVLGVNQDIFPATVSDSGVFTVSERECMRENKIEIADHSISDCLDEQFLLYFACTCAFERCYISYSNCGLGGSSLAPAGEIAGIIKTFEKLQIHEYNSELSIGVLETKESAFRKLAEHFSEQNDCTEKLSSYFLDDSDFSHRVKALFDYQNETKARLSSDVASDLYGGTLDLSASKVDDFAGCRFMYFCKYGLGAKSISRVDFDPLTRGNIVHYCLEKFVEKHINNIGSVDEDSIVDEVIILCDEFINKNGGKTSQFDEKFQYMLSLVKDTVVVLAKALNKEFAVSSFRPKFCEFEVGENKDINGIEVLTNDGKTVTLNGKIDRIDTTEDGKVRVVDYKTGSKGDDFKLAEILNGQNLQMLLYLYTVLKNGQAKIKASIPAGALYFPAKRDASVTVNETVRMNGVILDDVDTAIQMEPSLEGKIIPVKLKQGSDKFSTTEPLITAEAFGYIFKYIEKVLQDIGNAVLGGDITPFPQESGRGTKCDYCEYKSVCRFDKDLGFKELVDMKNSLAVEEIIKILKESEHGN